MVGSYLEMGRCDPSQELCLISYNPRTAMRKPCNDITDIILVSEKVM